ncbi:MAG: zf-HC2 domain-containing protein [Candidatus Cloacimonetes bacterium]|nr:zf-HC2 domain-containing protein [Candidatus Cloacimonadota bacterium]
MRCSKVRKLLTPYLDQELSGGMRPRLEKHLQSCGSCSQYTQQLKAVDAILQREDVAEMPGWLQERIIGQIKTHEPQRQSIRRRWKLLLVPITLALLLSLYTGTLVGIKTLTIEETETTKANTIVYSETTLYDLGLLNGDYDE